MAAPLDRPYRGSGADRPVGVPFPPDPMPLLRAGTLLKRLHYASFWSPDLLLCAAHVNVGPIAQEYWGVWDRREQRFREQTHYIPGRVSLLPRKLTVEDGDVSIDLPFEPANEFEVYRPEGRAFSDDFRSVSFSEGGELRFRQEANIRKRVGLFLTRSRYDHAFGAYEGSLPGGVELRNAVGVRERQDALW